MQSEAPATLQEIKIALENPREKSPWQGLLFIGWGLVLAKCLLAEWAIHKWQVPLRSGIIWWPTLLTAGAGTLAYIAFHWRRGAREPLTGRFVAAIWVACASALGLLAAAQASGSLGSVGLLPGLAAVLLGIAFWVHSVLDHRGVFRVAAIGWWLAAIHLLAWPTPDGLAWFALYLVLFQVGPFFGLWWKSRTAQAG